MTDYTGGNVGLNWCSPLSQCDYHFHRLPNGATALFVGLGLAVLLLVIGLVIAARQPRDRGDGGDGYRF